MTEIFDVTDNDVEAFQSTPPQESTEVNKQLEFDSEWADEQINLCDNELEGTSFISTEDIINEITSDKHSSSDPESEWENDTCREYGNSKEESEKPESDQPFCRYAATY